MKEALERLGDLDAGVACGRQESGSADDDDHDDDDGNAELARVPPLPDPPVYATSNGSEAMVGNMSLARHGMSRTSSAKPRKSAKQTCVCFDAVRAFQDAHKHMFIVIFSFVLISLPLSSRFHWPSTDRRQGSVVLDHPLAIAVLEEHKLLEEDDVHQEDDADGEAQRLGNGLVAGLRGKKETG